MCYVLGDIGDANLFAASVTLSRSGIRDNHLLRGNRSGLAS